MRNHLIHTIAHHPQTLELFNSGRDEPLNSTQFAAYLAQSDHTFRQGQKLFERATTKLHKEQQQLAKFAESDLLFQKWQTHFSGTKEDFKAWLLASPENVATAWQWWVAEHLTKVESSPYSVTDHFLPKHAITIADIQPYQGSNTDRLQLANGHLTLHSSPDWKIDRYTIQGDIEFTTTRNGFWLIFGKDEQDPSKLAALAFINGQAVTTRTIELNSNFSLLQDQNSTGAMKAENPFSPSLPVGTVVRVITNAEKNHTQVWIKRPDSLAFVHYLDIHKDDFSSLSRYTFGYNGFCVGIAGAENTGTESTNLVKNLARLDLSAKREKYAVLAVVGQSNAVGYDESVILSQNFPENDRLQQLGIYDESNLQIVPLHAHAHSWQDMRPFTNPHSEQQGTKAYTIHLLKPYLHIFLMITNY